MIGAGKCLAKPGQRRVAFPLHDFRDAGHLFLQPPNLFLDVLNSYKARLQFRPDRLHVDGSATICLGPLVIAASLEGGPCQQGLLLLVQGKAAQPGRQGIGFFGRIQEAQRQHFGAADQAFQNDIERGGVAGEEQDAPAARRAVCRITSARTRDLPVPGRPCRRKASGVATARSTACFCKSSRSASKNEVEPQTNWGTDSGLPAKSLARRAEAAVSCGTEVALTPLPLLLTGGS